MSNHIRSLKYEDQSWCGELLKIAEFHFKTVEQAVMNGLHPGKIVACIQCTKKIINCLGRGTNKAIDECGNSDTL